MPPAGDASVHDPPPGWPPPAPSADDEPSDPFVVGRSHGVAADVWRRRALWWRGDLVAAALVAVVAVVAGVWWWWPRADDPGVRVEAALPMATAPAPVPAPVVAHAAGAVLRPGLYELPPGSRVDDLLDAAGGPRLDADLDRVNLAAPLTDGERVAVPRVGEPAPPEVPAPGAGGGSAEVPSPASPLDLNTATPAQLEELPGVGPAIAAAIIAHRDEIGSFGEVDDLLDVTGIGPAKLAALVDLVVTG